MNTIQSFDHRSSARGTRTVARLATDVTISTAVVQAKAEVEATVVDALSALTLKAMQDVALISQVEQSLAQTVPHASGRLATIADLAAVQIASVVANSASRLRR